MTDNPLHYFSGGQGPAVVMVHGMAASLFDWTALGAAVEHAGFRAIAPDLLGHGESPKPDDPEAYGLRDVYVAFESWLESLALDGVHLVGHSLGGYLSIRYTLRFPERVRTLTLINPLYCIAQLSPLLRIFRRKPRLGVRLMDRAPLQVIESMMAWEPANPEGFSPEVVRQIALDYKRASPNILNITRHIPDLTPELQFVRPPALVIWGDSDLTLNPASFPRLAARLPNLIGYHRVPGSGHQPHVGKPELVNQLILDFLRKFPDR
jgi:pimeloyl-ACP methyl ester carboxylesterase